MNKLVLMATLAAMPFIQDDALSRADKLFIDRDNIDSLKQAISVLEVLVAKDQSSYEGFWRLAKLKYHLADRDTNQSNKEKLLQAAIAAGKKAVALDAGRVEGHFWLAASGGAYADLKGALQSLSLVKSIRREFEAAVAIDPKYENGDAYSALGQIDLNLPKLLGGNDKRGLERLEQGLEIGKTNADLKVTVAQVYIKRGRTNDARRLLESVINGTDPARSPQEQADLKSKAARLLAKLK